MIFADHLSRNIGPKESHEPTCKGLDIKIQDVYLNTSDEKCVSLAVETDETYDHKRVARYKGQLSPNPEKTLDIQG